MFNDRSKFHLNEHDLIRYDLILKELKLLLEQPMSLERYEILEELGRGSQGAQGTRLSSARGLEVRRTLRA